MPSMFRNFLQLQHYSSRLAVEGEATNWRLVAPQSGQVTDARRVYLTHKNDAGRLLALSKSSALPGGLPPRALTAGTVFCPEEEDYINAVRYAQHWGHNAVIL
jgi:hypothetical protein